MAKTYKAADLFCGAGGSSTGIQRACDEAGLRLELTAVNHWQTAINTHQRNHTNARHLCADIDSLNPRHYFDEGELDLLWASPECTHHSKARGGKPIHDQSRATAFCVTRWADALRPKCIVVENVVEFLDWAPLGSNGRPMKSRKGEIFRAWVAMLEAIGYTVEWRKLIAADYGDPTTRERVFIQCVRGRDKIVWPERTHASRAEIEALRTQAELFAPKRQLAPWVSAADGVIDWSIPTTPISQRKRPLAENTLRRINEGIERYGSEAVIIAMEHGGRVLPAHAPLPTVTTAKGGAFGLAYLLPQHSAGVLRPVSQPAPTVATRGAIALVVEYYGNGVARPVTNPLPTVTCKDRFALVQAYGNEIHFRMLKLHELARAQGFPSDYHFTGNITEGVRQVGNSVPVNTAHAITRARITSN